MANPHKTAVRIRIPVATFILACLTGSAATAQEGTGHKLFVQSTGPWAQRTSTSPATTDTWKLRAAGATGVMKQLLVPISYAGEAFNYPTSDVQSLYYGTGSPARYSLPRFYTEASRGVFTINGKVIIPIALPRTRAEYTGSYDRARFGGVGDSLSLFIKDVLAGVDSTIDLAPYAEVDGGKQVLAALVIIQPHQGGECTSASNRGIWAHRYSVSALLPGMPDGYATRTSAGGQPVYINDYILQAAEQCYVPGALGGTGTVIHETGHLIGLPDLYGTGTEVSRPVGKWDLMGEGNYYTTDSPAQLGAWSRWILGWTNSRILPIPQSGAVTDTIYRSVMGTGRIDIIPFLDTPEFLILEDRRKEGSDNGALAGNGMIIWRIDPRIADESHFRSNTVNSNRAEPGVSIYQADGLANLDKAENAGDAGDPWPGTAGATTLDATTTPAWKSRAGVPQGQISKISYSLTQGAVFTLSAAKNEEPQDQPYGEMLIIPAILPPAAAGVAYSTRLTLQAAADTTATVEWTVLASGPLENAKITADGRNATLTGLAAKEGTAAIAVKAVIKGARGTQSSVATLILVTVGDPHYEIERLARALTGVQPLTDNEGTFYDSAGNRNGRLDIGDVIIAIKSGRLTWTGGTFIPNPVKEKK